jgi:hypothetical protein
MEQRKKAGEMTNKTNSDGLEKQKIELIKLRIKNKFYDRDDVYEKVISELIKKELK